MQSFNSNKASRFLASLIFLTLPLLAVGLSSIEYLFGFREFWHDDIVYNYFPFRTWFTLQLSQGVWPIWDPMSGLGNFAELWTTVPVDLLTPVELLFSFSYPELQFIQAILLTTIIFLSILWLSNNWVIAVASTVAYVFAPVTSFFFGYYIHGWPLVLYAFLSVGLFKVLAEKNHRAGGILVVLTPLFILGGKLELIFYAYATVCLGAAFFWLFCRPRLLLDRSLFIVILAVFLPLLVSYWAFEAVFLAIEYGIRNSVSEVEPLGLSTISALVLDSEFVVITGALLIFSNARLRDHRRVQSSVARYLSGSGLVVAISWYAILGDISWHIFASFLAGLMGAVAVCSLKRSHRSDRFWSLVVPASMLIWLYWARTSGGSLDELWMLEVRTSLVFQSLLIFFSVLGLSVVDRKHANWVFSLLLAFWLLRNLGAAFLPRTIGVLWLPARDNFLFDFPCAYLAGVGIFRTVKVFTDSCCKYCCRLFRWRAKAKSVGAMQFAALSLWALAALFGNLNMQPHEITKGRVLLSEKILQASPAAIIESEESEVPKRILNFFHSMYRRDNIANVRQYSSLVSDRYATYSVASRLGISTEDVTFGQPYTAALGRRLRILSGVDSGLPESVPPSIPSVYWYFFYLIRGVPALDCRHLQVMGVELIDGVENKYNAPNSNTFNHLYSLTPDRLEILADDVEAKLSACQFEKVIVNDHVFLRPSNHHPRAFLIHRAAGDVDPPGWPELGAYHPVRVIRYSPNEIQIELPAVSSPGTLILTDLFNEEWRAEVDGVDREIVPIEQIFRGVQVNIADREVRFSVSSLPAPIVILGYFVNFLVGIFLVRKFKVDAREE